jgi:hypothetical protein
MTQQREFYPYSERWEDFKPSLFQIHTAHKSRMIYFIILRWAHSLLAATLTLMPP